MPPAADDRLAELGDFLAALHVNGVAVGPGEIESLRHLFSRQPVLDRAGLQALLAALLVKTPAQRQTFDGLFAAWCPDCDADWPPAGPESESASASTPTPAANAPAEQPYAPPKPPAPDLWPRWRLIAAALLLFGALLWAVWPAMPGCSARRARYSRWRRRGWMAGAGRRDCYSLTSSPCLRPVSREYRMPAGLWGGIRRQPRLLPERASRPNHSGISAIPGLRYGLIRLRNWR
jgi:hypothetical protein